MSAERDGLGAAQMKAGQWQAVTAKLMSSGEVPDGLLWIALEDGRVVMGRYEWRQGRNPDRFKGDEVGDISVFDATHIMEVERPVAPIQSVTA